MVDDSDMASTSRSDMTIVNVHTPTSSFALPHSCKFTAYSKTNFCVESLLTLSPGTLAVANDTLQSLFSKVDKKVNVAHVRRGDPVGPGFLKYEWNKNVWNLDDGE